MRDLKHVPVMVVAGLVTAAALVWVLVTHLLAALAILGAAGALVLLLRHGERLTVAWWPRRQQDAAVPASTTGQQAPGPPETAKQDEWLP